MKIVPPPKSELHNIIQIGIEKSKQGVSNTITDDKKRYVHWDKLRHLNPPDKFDTIESYWAFIKFSRFPQYKPLPFIEDFVYILTDEIQQNLHDIDTRMRGSVESKTINDNKDRYIVGSLIEEAISSSQLEGAATTRKVAKDMLTNNRTPKGYSQQMIYNNYQAIQFINRHKDEDLSPGLILELHKIVTTDAIDNPDDVGRFRQDNTVSVVDNRTQQVLHTPPDFETLADRLTILCDFANGKSPDYFIHPVIRAIIVHFILAYDHPFADGNGRTTRALFYWVILKKHYWLFQYITLSSAIKKSPTKYGESFLMSETDDFDLTYFINSQLIFITNAIDNLFDYVEQKQQQIQDASNLLSAYLADGKLNSRQVMLINHAIKHAGASYTLAGHKISHHISYATAKADLEKLAKLDLLQQSKRGRAFVFIAPIDLEDRIKAYR